MEELSPILSKEGGKKVNCIRREKGREITRNTCRAGSGGVCSYLRYGEKDGKRYTLSSFRRIGKRGELDHSPLLFAAEKRKRTKRRSLKSRMGGRGKEDERLTHHSEKKRKESYTYTLLYHTKRIKKIPPTLGGGGGGGFCGPEEHDSHLPNRGGRLYPKRGEGKAFYYNVA